MWKSLGSSYSKYAFSFFGRRDRLLGAQEVALANSQHIFFESTYDMGLPKHLGFHGNAE